MKALTVSPREGALIALLKRAQLGGLVPRSPESRQFILAEIDDFDREIELTRKNKRLMKLLDERAKQTRAISLAEAAARLGSRRAGSAVELSKVARNHTGGHGNARVGNA